MSKILIAYATNSGSTGEVAESVAAELSQGGHDTEVSLISEVKDLCAYDAVVVGAPMILGWHQQARRFIKRYQAELATKKVAYFACALRLTQAAGESLPQLPIFLDPTLLSDPEKQGSLTFKERFTTIGHYLRPMLQAASGVKPVSIAFFNGKLEMFRLKWWQAAFVMIVVGAGAGDFRDWNYIKSWACSLVSSL